MNSNDLSNGMAIKMDGKLFVITETEHRTPGNLRAFIQIKIRDLKSGSFYEKRLRSGEHVEQVDLDRRPMEFLYQQGSAFVFMDLESYEQTELQKEIVGDLAKYVLPNTTIIVCWCDGKPLSVELPLTVTLTVTDTSPGIKGATATNQLKEALCETGLATRVPPFITIGEKIIVSTDDGSYRSRA
ncbi:MAG: elongation factor P [Planctomycetota bacterium]|jgi:elongation factor P|nr:MAG: elongation factor P [Planctomycetota bacterium]RLS91606.1 MAG: elongation factor P [Planctomycetota bacterium]